ncbi:hypothetical protein GX50_05167 [[Emmonsia] crescens]|uniref:C2H2-type domain-containing protein n=1 Tax=[Emmonsia] crescens TaxID=73230 RepID=A0A2B7ZG97_9EURO|nr:hypothetical protein GX50_05167 [Emmonsia crescens]
MTTSTFNLPLPPKLDDEVYDAELPSGCRWAYPCKLPSCPDYGKSWILRSTFLLHLQERDAHMATVTTPVARRASDTESRYTTDPYLPLRAASDFWS